MSEILDIAIPRETVNDDFVTIAGWHFDNGAKVKQGDIVVSVETSKAVIEIEAEGGGYLEISRLKGEEVEIGAVIGKIHEKAGEFAIADPTAARQTASREVQSTRVSALAQAMIDKEGIDISVFNGKSLIRKADVMHYLHQQNGTNGHSTAEVKQKETEKQEEEVQTIEIQTSEKDVKGVFGDMKKSAGERGKPLIWLALNYIFRNWMLGHMARWAPLGVNLWIHRLRGVKMGKGVYIDPAATIETAYPENITIGNDVRVTANAIIMTHIKAPHHLRNTGIMPVVLKPVVLEDHCFIGVNSVIMPGVTVGKGAVIASGSVVSTNVPPYTMVAGNPAKIVKKFELKEEGK